MPVTIDIIILSYAKTEALKQLTEQTIYTCLASEHPANITFNIVVVESNASLKPYQYEHTTTIYPDVKFGFHRYLNIGIKNTSANYICLCNNDLIFHPNWASAIVEEMERNPKLQCASTFCPEMHTNAKLNAHNKVIIGYETLFSGWCFMIKRSLIEKIGLFDEAFEFWYADADFLKTLRANQIQNALVTNAVVSHLNAVTSKSLSKGDYFRYTILPQLYFNYKWKRDSYLKYKLKEIYFRLRFFLKLI